jgi:hypothetical protein
MSDLREIVYVNGGEVYKAQTDEKLKNQYFFNAEKADPIFPFIKGDGKRYIFTDEYKSYFPESNFASSGNLEDFDLCPSVDLWICLAATTPEERLNYDLYFAVNSSEQLKKVSEYYNLPYPCTPDIDNLIDNHPHDISFWNIEGRAVVPAGVKFVNGKPAILKQYTYPKLKNNWEIWMMGRAYYQKGTVYEEGGYFTRLCGGITEPGKDYNGRMSDMTQTLKISKRVDGTITEYRFNDSGATDPFIGWAGFESDGRKREFETCKHVQEVMAGYKNKGAHFEDQHDLTTLSPYWFARSHYGNPEEWAEVYFAAMSSSQVKSIADYYGLENPLNEFLAKELDSGKGNFRVRHYPIADGETFIPITAGSVIFENNVAKKILFYTFIRPWEYTDSGVAIPEYLLDYYE